MRNYSECAMVVNGNKTSTLQIFSEHNVFTCFEYGECVFMGNWLKTFDFVSEWKTKKQPIVDMFKANGIEAHFEGWEE